MEILFYVLAAVAIGGAFGVVLARTPVGSLLFMVSALASLAGVDMAEAVRKYEDGCPRCRAVPCTCPPKRSQRTAG